MTLVSHMALSLSYTMSMYYVSQNVVIVVLYIFLNWIEETVDTHCIVNLIHVAQSSNTRLHLIIIVSNM